MSGSTLRTVLVWLPRVAGLATSAFIGLFALDAFEGKTLFEGLPGFVIHLIPSMFLFAVVTLSWRREWIGAIVFTLLAAAYALSVPSHPNWILVISGPLLLTAVLYAVNWWTRHAGAQPALSH